MGPKKTCYFFVFLVLLFNTIETNQLHKQLALLEVNLTSLAHISQKQVTAFEQFFSEMLDLDKEIKEIGTLVHAALKKSPAVALKEKAAIQMYIQNNVLNLVNNISSSLAQFPQLTHTYVDGQLGLYLIRQLEEKLKNKLTERDFLATIYYESDPAAFAKDPSLLAQVTFIRLILGMGLEVPETNVFYRFSIDRQQAIAIIKNQAKQARKEFEKQEHPDKIPKSAYPEFNKKLDQYAMQRFKIIQTDLESISEQPHDVIDFIQDMFKLLYTRVDTELSNPSHFNLVYDTVQNLENIRRNLNKQLVKTRFQIYEKLLTTLKPEQLGDVVDLMKTFYERQPATTKIAVLANIEQSTIALKKSIFQAYLGLKKIPPQEQAKHAQELLKKIQTYLAIQQQYALFMPEDNLHDEIVKAQKWIEQNIGAKISAQEIGRTIFSITNDIKTNFGLLINTLFDSFITAGAAIDQKDILDTIENIKRTLETIADLSKKIDPTQMELQEQQFTYYLLSRLYLTVHNVRTRLALAYYIYDREEMRSDPYEVFSQFEALLPGQSLFIALRLSYLLPDTLPQPPLDQTTTAKLKNMRTYLTTDMVSRYRILNENEIKNWLSGLKEPGTLNQIIQETKSTITRMDNAIKQLEQDKNKITNLHNKKQKQAYDLFASQPTITKATIEMQKIRDQSKKDIEEVFAKFK